MICCDFDIDGHLAFRTILVELDPRKHVQRSTLPTCTIEYGEILGLNVLNIFFNDYCLGLLCRLCPATEHYDDGK